MRYYRNKKLNYRWRTARPRRV